MMNKMTKKNISLFGIVVFAVAACLAVYVLWAARNYEEDTLYRAGQQQTTAQAGFIVQPQQTTPQPVNSPAPDAAHNTQAQIPESLEIQTIVRFGNHYWRVLDVQEGKAFLLAENIIKRMPFIHDHDFVQGRRYANSWEDSRIRQWLNDDFYMTFSYDERVRIAETHLAHNNNPWWYGADTALERNLGWGMEHGNDTVDKIFLLCIYDVLYYFGHSGTLDQPDVWLWCECCDRQPIQFGLTPILDDSYNSCRMARYNGRTSPWWLRTTGQYGRLIVQGSGIVSSHGLSTISPSGVRPALWIYSR